MAVTYFGKAIEHDKSFQVAYLGRAVTYSEMGEYDLAIDDCDTAIELSPLDPKPYFQKVWLCEQKQMYKEAIETYRKLIANIPSDKAAVEKAKNLIRVLGEKV